MFMKTPHVVSSPIRRLQDQQVSVCPKCGNFHICKTQVFIGPDIMCMGLAESFKYQ